MTSGAPALLLSVEDRRRVAQVHALVTAGASSVDELVRWLGDPSWVVRREVIFGLAQLGDAAVPAMCQALVSQRDLEARIAALVEALSASQGNPDEALLALLASNDPAVVCDAAQVLGRRQTPGALASLAALVEHGDDNVSVAAIEALGRIGGLQSVDRLVGVLESGNFFRVFPAIDVVGRLGDARATDPLVQLTGKALYTLEATRALGRIGDARAVPALTALLDSPAKSQVRTSAWALWEIHKLRFAAAANVAMQAPAGWKPPHPEQTAQRLIEALPKADRDEQVALCHVLGWFATRAAVATLLALLTEEGAVAEAARSSLARVGDSIDSDLIASLRTGDSARRKLLLPFVGRSPARAEVELSLTDPDPAVCAAACAALARLGDPGAVPALFKLLPKASPQVGQAAVNAILSLGSHQTERLALAAAGSADPIERRLAVRIVATLGYESGLPILLRAIEDSDERLRDIALPGLALLESSLGLDALLAAAVHASLRTRTAAVRALGQAGPDPRVDKALRAALVHEDAWVRYHACHSLGRRKDTGAVDALVLRLADDAGQVRIAAVEALSHLPGALAKQVLQTAALSTDPDMRRAALAGLGLTGDPDVLPTLLEAAQSGDESTRLVALSALAGFSQPEALAALVVAANDVNEGVRSAAVGVMMTAAGRAPTLALVGLIGGLRSRRPALQALTHPVEGRVQVLLGALEAAGEALVGPLAATLARIPRPDAREGLVLALQSPNVLLRRAAATALAGAGPAAMAALAVVALRDPDFEVRRLAAMAMEQ